ncbi:MAG TPA: glyoxalase/bleomycin resistance/extradiol dioxygenase family protein [Candidatus Nanoarchaeia archaeon]|nr:glyoxalase/bleomycin resistance/extradiol dioxygenase family protein [Candidatus Nanoarchaeia archaeon]
MPDIKLSLIVLRSKDIDSLRIFYELLGFSFSQEQHGNGPIHYASTNREVVIELYPTLKKNVDNTLIGFKVSNLEALLHGISAEYIPKPPSETSHGKAVFLRDPDGRLIRLEEFPKQDHNLY